MSLWQACKDGIVAGAFKGRVANAIINFLKLVDDLAEIALDQALHEIAETCVSATGLIDYHSKESGERGLARKENLEELVSAARQFTGDLVFPTMSAATQSQDRLPEAGSALEAFLDQVALDSGDTQTETGPALQMMTLHSAKGLEFPLVFLVGLEEGLFPHRMSADEPGRMEEERRLCYVGITRAMQELYLTYAETRRLHGTDTYNRPSRFVGELPAEVLEEVRMRGAISRPMGGMNSRFFEEPVEGGLHMGQRVKHAKFGEGIVMQCEGGGDRARIQVNFENAGAKWLMLGYANLAALD